MFEARTEKIHDFLITFVSKQNNIVIVDDQPDLIPLPYYLTMDLYF